MPQTRPSRRKKQQTPVIGQDQMTTVGAAGRCFTPENGMSTPGYPDSPERAPLTEPPSGANASPEVATLCPMPRRAFGPSSISSPTARRADSHASLPGSPGSGTALVDEAVLELRELMACPDKEAYSSYHFRPLSSVSTSAGPTPGPEERPSSSVSQIMPGTAPSPDEWLMNSTSPVPSPSPSPAIDGKQQETTLATKPQTQKVFVGGVPQDLNQDDLRAIFNQYAAVKKAWLQRCRDVTMNQGQSLTRSHRGFGFVIFQEASALNTLLGEHMSRFITLTDGRRLEVKRAISSNDMLSSGASEPQREVPRPPNQNYRQQGPRSPPPLPPAQPPADPRQGSGMQNTAAAFIVGNQTPQMPPAQQMPRQPQGMQQMQIIQAPWQGLAVQGHPPKAPQQMMVASNGSPADNRAVTAMMPRGMPGPTAMLVPANNGQMLAMQMQQMPASGDASQRNGPPPQSGNYSAPGYAVPPECGQLPHQNLVLAATPGVPPQQAGWQLQVTQNNPPAPAPTAMLSMNLPFEILNTMQGGVGYAVPYTAPPPEPRASEGWNQNAHDQQRISQSAASEPLTPSPSPPPQQASFRDIEIALLQAMPEHYDE